MQQSLSIMKGDMLMNKYDKGKTSIEMQTIKDGNKTHFVKTTTKSFGDDLKLSETHCKTSIADTEILANTTSVIIAYKNLIIHDFFFQNSIKCIACINKTDVINIIKDIAIHQKIHSPSPEVAKYNKNIENARAMLKDISENQNKIVRDAKIFGSKESKQK